VADENPLRRAGHAFGRCVIADPGIHTKLPPIAVIAGCEMKVRSIVFDLAFGLPSRSSKLRSQRIMKTDHSSTKTRLVEVLARTEWPFT